MDSGKPPSLNLAGFESVPIQVTVRVGGARCPLGALAELAAGAVIVLDRAVGAPFDLLAEGRPIGAVEPVVDEGAVAVKLVAAAEDPDDAAP